MEIALISDSEAESILKHPIVPGFTTKLLGNGNLAKTYRNEKVFVCRHCSQVRGHVATVVEKESSAVLESQITEEDSSEPSSKTEKCTERIYTFHGLRSHLKGR
jgi:hypothetical protein